MGFMPRKWFAASGCPLSVLEDICILWYIWIAFQIPWSTENTSSKENVFMSSFLNIDNMLICGLYPNVGIFEIIMKSRLEAVIKKSVADLSKIHPP